MHHLPPILLLLFLLATPTLGSTPILERRVSLGVQDESIASILTAVAEQGEFSFSYSPDAIDANRTASISIQNQSVRYALNELFNGNVTYRERGRHLILQPYKSPKRETEAVVEGYLYDSTTGERLTQATVYNLEQRAAATTDEYGYFRMELAKGIEPTEVRVSKMGYDEVKLMPIEGDRNFVSVEMSASRAKPQVLVNVLPKSNTNWGDRIISERIVSSNLIANTQNISDSLFRALQLSAFPHVSTNRLLSGTTSNYFSLNLTVGFIQSVSIMEIGGVANIVREDAGVLQAAGVANIIGGMVSGFQAAGVLNSSSGLSGFQVAGVSNITTGNAGFIQLAGVNNTVKGTFIGLQTAGVINTSSTLHGMQVAGVSNYSSKASGSQIAGVSNIAASVNGLQAAGAMNQSKNADGVQLAGALNNTDSLTGAQIAGAVNISGVSQGAQIAGAANFAKSLNGMQLSGAINSADTIKGAQLSGFLNRAGYMKGLQVGVVNIADTCSGIPIGLLSIVRRNGYLKLDIYADEVFQTNIGFRSGIRRFYNIFQAGVQPAQIESAPVWTFGLGLGTSFRTTDKLYMDIDLMAQQVAKGSHFSEVNMLYKVGIGADWQFAPRVSLSFGVTYNMYLTDTQSEHYASTFSTLAPYSLSSNSIGETIELSGWFGGRIGVRFF